MLAKNKKTKKGKYQSIFFSVFFGVLVFGFIGFLIFSSWKVNTKRSELLDQIGRLQKEIRALEEKNNQLKAGISQTGQDAYWEERIREQGYKKPGEEQVVVLPPKTQNENKQEAPKTLWQKFLDIFK